VSRPDSVVEEAEAPVPLRPYTLAFDVGGTGLKASVLDARGLMMADRVRVPTTYPVGPDGPSGMVERLAALSPSLPAADRASVGFPGMVRSGVVLSAPHFVTTAGPGSPVDAALVERWTHFDMASALGDALGLPTKVANDADVQGAAVVAGEGLEMVVTLGTGFGTAMFLDGRLLPHLEIAHQPFRKGQTYDQQLGEKVRKQVGEERWSSRVRRAIEQLDAMIFFDHLFLGGGNGRRVQKKVLQAFDGRVTVVDNTAGILGGIKLWEHDAVGD
jgi:polyphosphate glucokinase